MWIGQLQPSPSRPVPHDQARGTGHGSRAPDRARHRRAARRGAQRAEPAGRRQHVRGLLSAQRANRHRRGLTSAGLTAPGSWRDHQVATDRVATLLQASDQRGSEYARVRQWRPCREQPEPIGPAAGLSGNATRRGDCRTTQEGEKIPPSHTMRSQEVRMGRCNKV